MLDCTKVVKAMNLRPAKDKKTIGVIKCGSYKDTTMYYKSIDQAREELEMNILCMDIENYDKETTQKWLDVFNQSCDKILVLNPIPDNIKEILKKEIHLDKDIDGFINSKSCTATAVREILEYYKIPPRGKAVVLGSNIGWEIAKELKDMGYTITVCNSRTIGLKAETKQADILVSAVGKKNLITADMVKEDAIVIDVGLGDVSKEVREKAMVTPIKDGVGLVTTAVLMREILNS